MGHIHVALAAPLGADDVAQVGCDQDESTVAVRERPDDPGAPADLAHDALEGVVGAQAAPVLRGKLEVLERLLDAFGYDVGRSLSRVRLLSEDGIEISHGVVGGDAKNSV